jgi:N-acetylglucosaminyl-diphospho-decaprenol L-rhamnosyltransferase
MELSYCVVNTAARERLLACLEAIERTRPEGIDTETIVLDNASGDGSAEAVRALGRDIRLIELDRRQGKAVNDTTLLAQALGDYCLLLNEDTELQDEAPLALLDALEADPGAAVAGAQLLDPHGRPVPCAWRLPGLDTALAGAVFAHRLYTVQSGGETTRAVGWVQSSAMLVRRQAAEEVGYLDPAFFVYSDETDFQKRLRDAGWRSLYVPAARAIHHEQLASEAASGSHRIVEFHRNRDLYVRKHHGPLVAAAVRGLTAWSYLARALAALALPGRSPRLFLSHARQALLPRRGEGVRELAERAGERRS